MAEYIKRTDVMKICEGYNEHCFSSNDAKGQDIADRILDDVVEIPSADVEEVKHGEWLPQVVLGVNTWDCSECKTIGSPHWKRCPICEAKMDGGKEE